VLTGEISNGALFTGLNVTPHPVMNKEIPVAIANDAAKRK
jgi:hypothetical protein